MTTSLPPTGKFPAEPNQLERAELAAHLEAEGVTPPPKPLESFTKKELVSMLKSLLGESLK
ncbi:hypothetical protein SynBIOSU31_01917 [Synechococcus sp. BIOS-U3-1]|uniref:hypothetical protein n=1 Tax=Synechococcus sp. BIOS-U3-1 TaxID=1400865 RepID=UPI0016490C4C|nr:hypothetical protein [Synechococcus sp. BIOS-U3-1]QNI58784.1 hypothetical protein SynBIOSU31_01917 [Synechococcus sp. BIOS-U3-1]